MLESSPAKKDLRVFINNKLNVRQKCALSATRANHISIAILSREVIVVLYSVLL